MFTLVGLIYPFRFKYLLHMVGLFVLMMESFNFASSTNTGSFEYPNEMMYLDYCFTRNPVSIEHTRDRETFFHISNAIKCLLSDKSERGDITLNQFHASSNEVAQCKSQLNNIVTGGISEKREGKRYYVELSSKIIPCPPAHDISSQEMRHENCFKKVKLSEITGSANEIKNRQYVYFSRETKGWKGLPASAIPAGCFSKNQTGTISVTTLTDNAPGHAKSCIDYFFDIYALPQHSCQKTIDLAYQTDNDKIMQQPQKILAYAILELGLFIHENGELRNKFISQKSLGRAENILDIIKHKKSSSPNYIRLLGIKSKGPGPVQFIIRFLVSKVCNPALRFDKSRDQILGWFEEFNENFYLMTLQTSSNLMCDIGARIGDPNLLFLTLPHGYEKNQYFKKKQLLVLHFHCMYVLEHVWYFLDKSLFTILISNKSFASVAEDIQKYTKSC